MKAHKARPWLPKIGPASAIYRLEQRAIEFADPVPHSEWDFKGSRRLLRRAAIAYARSLGWRKP